MDYFDASINRVAALALGARNMEKALLKALLTPWDLLKKYQDEEDFTSALVISEEIKTLPFDVIWEKYCEKQGVIADDSWFEDVKKYEQEVLLKR